MIVVHQSPPAFGLPCVSPFGTKVETYLRMAGLPYRTAPGDPFKAPKGKLPWIEDDGQAVADSSDIIDHLKARHGDPLDKDLTPAQRAVAQATRRMLEEHLYWVSVYTRWIPDDGYALTRAVFKPILPPVVGGLLLDRVVRRSLTKALHTQGLGRHSAADIYRRGAEDVDALSVLLGTTPYFLGDHPSSIDATVFAFTAHALLPPGDNPLKRRVAAHQNLVAYVERMNRRYFAGAEPASTAERS